jgi:hypothetical protein
MGVIQDRRPRDWAYLAEFSQEDLPALQEMVKHINETHDVKTIELFNSNCERVLHGLDPDIGTPIPTGVLKTDDLTTNAGLQQCINIIIGTSSTRWQYMGLGSGGTTAPTTSQTDLVAAAAGGRIDMAASGRGWREAVGMKLFFGAIGNELAATFTYTELGVFNSSSGGTMLNRNAFPDNGLTHTINRSASIISSVIEFCPVA